MARRTSRQNQDAIRQPAMEQGMAAHHHQQTHHIDDEHRSRRLRHPATHHQTQRTSVDAGRRAHNPRHLPKLPQHAHRHARSRIGHMPKLPQRMGRASNQSSPRRKTMASANHRHTQRRGKRAETIRPDHITQPHQPMAQTRQTVARHADGTQAAVHVQPRRVGRTPDSTCKCNGWFRVGLF